VTLAKSNVGGNSGEKPHGKVEVEVVEVPSRDRTLQQQVK
jgi:hypothetical protein